jgi:peptide-methionine (S)-S-oxide reductase
VGYTGGTTPDPTYRNIGDHAEALQIDFDPEIVTYDELLAVFFSSHDCTRAHFSTQYMSAVYAADADQLRLAREAGAAAATARGGELATSIRTLDRFYRAEDYHQKYRLRRHTDLCAELCARFGGDRGMVDSTVAARLNGLLGGHGRRRDWLEELERWGLSEASRELVRARVA